MNKRKHYIYNTISALLGTVAALGVCLIVAFWLLVISGFSPRLQTLWVCTAMTTMDHKYLATLFIPAETIEEIMEANKVDDSQHNSIILNFNKEESASKPQKPAKPDSKPSDKTEAETDPIQTETVQTNYEAEGYKLLEEGLWLKELSGSGWRGYMMLVEDPLRVKLVDTSKQYTCGENVKTMIQNSGAVAGINGGGFQDGANYDSNGGMPAGILIEDSQLIYPYQADNTTVYNLIGLNGDGALVLRHCTTQWALDNNIVSAVTFWPFLVVNGEGLIKNGTGGWGLAPRTAIGQRETGEILMLVVDGRQVDWSIGCDLDVLQDVMLEEGAFNAAMLDGGSSTAMLHGDTYINRPSLGHERWINNAFVVMPK